ncbi:sensor histidine kinase [Catenuloplanes indicus]|uniref:Sensor-like histidine kinase SenX3 n=1 Tax=Catenuloplanes indicus TaxID=137267 RepID=A0AAE3VVM6_9ACTN|nr:ATP-binding protein [Catenuloplanes indicus]MDQ0365083.1 signal transduction histidine kinase [Catenuloplanes indicus]
MRNIEAASPVDGRRRSLLDRRAVALLAVVVLLGGTGTVLTVWALRSVEHDRAVQALEERTRGVSGAVEGYLRQYTLALEDLAAGVAAQQDLRGDDFAAITAPLNSARLPGASGVAFVVPAATAQVSQVERQWRARASTGLTLQPAAGQTEHLFVVLSRTFDGTRPRLGRDLSASAPAAEAIALARRTGEVTVSSSYVLLKDRELPVRLRQQAFVFAAGVWAPPGAPDAGRLRGVLILGLRAGDFLADTIGEVAGPATAVTLTDTATSPPAPVASWDTGRRHQPHARTADIDIPPRTWQLTVTATDRLLDATQTRLDDAAVGAGSVVTVLLTALVGLVLLSRARILRRVDEATAALHEDIARREKVEAELRQRETELVGFTGVVAHDLRSPLSTITAYADLLADETTDVLDPAQQSLLGRIRAGADRMRTLIDDLLAYATADNSAIHRSPVDLGALVDDIITERLAPLTTDRPYIEAGPLPTVPGDPGMLRQLLDNLIGNAIKYTRYGRPAQVEISSRRLDDGFWRIDVADHGIGIPAGQHESVFAAFTRATGSDGYPGTGLGLAICHRIVTRHGGTIAVTDNDGGGSRFHFTIPDQPPAPGSDQAPAGRGHISTGRDEGVPASVAKSE